MLTLADLQFGELASESVRVTAGTTTQVKTNGGVLHRLLVGAAPAADRAITLRNGTQDTDPIVTVITVPVALAYPAIPVGLAFPNGIRAMFSGAVDVTFCFT